MSTCGSILFEIKYRKKEVQLEYVKTRNQVVDILTRPLSFDTFNKLKTLLGMIQGRKINFKRGC